MKIIIIYASFHHLNTYKIAKVISKELNSKIFSFQEVEIDEIMKADLIGFGSGVYFSYFHKGLINLIKSLNDIKNKKTFIFSTSGLKKNIFFNRSHKHFKKILESKNFKVIDEFTCLAYDNYGFLKIVGGINRGRPNNFDLKKVKNFAINLIRKKI